jgi:hypothetical protein
MQRDPHVDRALGQLWLISDILTHDVNAEVIARKAEVAEWEPAPMPDDYIPETGDFT